ncbi:MAG TPA: Ldh family oxidoreductase, partial [Roseiflexaceae bacterium]|nr:Ldh family oxidoreductase [Roseiflexaceae bacterium]
GIVRVAQYLDSIAAGETNPAATPQIAHETAVVTMVEAQRGFGQVAARYAIDVTIAKAGAHGLAATAIRHCNHAGRMGEWVQIAADAGVIALAFCNTGRPGGAVAPHGGAGRLLGPNPIAAAGPVAGRPPVVIDFATSAVAEGKLRIARNRGEAIPAGWILDAAGQPSTDPADFYRGGFILPAAGHKGYALALLAEFLGGLLTDVAGETFVRGNGILFIGIAPGAFRPAEEFLAEAAELCTRAATTSPAAGFSEVLLPGEPEQRSAAIRRAEGITLDEITWRQLVDRATQLGVAVDI